MEIVCPFCQHGLAGEKTHCQSCGCEFSRDDWPEEAVCAKGLSATLTLKYNGKLWHATSEDFLVGRNVGGEGLKLNHPSVSSEHVRIYREAGRWLAESVRSPFFWNGEAKESAVLTSGGILAIGACVLQVEILYRREFPPTEVRGELQSERFLDWRDQNRILIGSDGAQCNIMISGIEPIHAILYRQKRTGEWWIVDCASPTGTRLNRKWIRNARLYPEDVLQIASVSIHVSENGLSVGGTSDEGFEVRVEGLCAQAGKKRILTDVHFLVKPGEFLGVLGPSGCGKSSFIQRLVGLGNMSAGKIFVNHLGMESVQADFLRKTAYLPQQTALHSSLTLEQECDCFCRIHSPSLKEGKQKIAPSLKLMGLENEGKKQVGSLSGGQKRRAGIALELLRSPKLLLLDEPTSGPGRDINVIKRPLS